MSIANKPNVEVLVGLPGCGKTTYAKTKASSGDWKIFSSDNIRFELGITEQNKECNRIVFETLHKRIKKALIDGENCIFDATNMSRKNRMYFIKSLGKIPCHKICTLFLVPIKECKARNALRCGSARVPDYVYDRMLKSFDPPFYYEGFDEITIVNNCKNHKIEWTWDELINFNQDNKNHSLTLGLHMVEALVKMTDDNDRKDLNESLLEAALFHDIGKIYTKDFHNANGEETENAHYYEHHNYGSYVYMVDAIKRFENELHGEYSLDVLFDILHAAVLINWHMRPLTAWNRSESAREKDRKLLGEDLYNEIVMLNMADLGAH